MSARRGRPKWRPTEEQRNILADLVGATDTVEELIVRIDDLIDTAIRQEIPSVHIASAARCSRFTIAKRRKEVA